MTLSEGPFSQCQVAGKPELIVASNWRVPLLDPARTYALLEGDLSRAFRRVIRSGHYILGPEVEALENNVSKWLGVENCVGTSSGTDALLAALMALEIGPGDEVVTSPLTFVSTAEVILRLGAIPVFADVCPVCLCIHPNSAAAALSTRTRAILAVHLFGQLGHIRELSRLARDHGIDLIEDACQAFGSTLDNQNAGTFGRAACFSFFPSKPFGGFGDAGLVCTNDRHLTERLRSVRSHGRTSKHRFVQLGGNFRIDSLHAALLNVLIPRVKNWLTIRRQQARTYTDDLRHVSGVVTPGGCGYTESAWGAYTIRVPEYRDALVRHLANDGVETAIYYPLTLAEQPLFSGKIREAGALRHATRAAREVVSLPIFPGLSLVEQTLVTASIGDFFKGMRARQPSFQVSP